MPASAALVDASAAMAGAMRPMMMPADAVPQYMQPGEGLRLQIHANMVWMQAMLQ